MGCRRAVKVKILAEKLVNITFRKIQNMTWDQIEKVINPENVGKNVITISFKSRNNIKGLFIQMQDFNELKMKNFWRVIPEKNIVEWKKTRNMNLARIFNGQEFTRLVIDKATAA